MADLEIRTDDATNIEFAKADVNGTVTTMDETWINAALVYAEVGKEADLSDGERISTTGDDAVVSEGGSGSPRADDLDPDTTYYFRAKADAVDFSDSTLISAAAESPGFMDSLAGIESGMDELTDEEVGMDVVTDSNNAMNKITGSELAMDKVADKEVAMDKVTDKEMAMDLVTDKNMAFRKFLLSTHILGTCWIKEVGSEGVWISGTPNNFPHTETQDGAEVEFTLDTDDPAREDGRALRLEAISEADSDDPEFGWSKVIDFTDVDELKLVYRHRSNERTDRFEITIQIGDDEVFSRGDTDPEDVEDSLTLDVSSYSGEQELFLGGRRNRFDDAGDEYFIHYTDIELNEDA